MNALKGQGTNILLCAILAWLAYDKFYAAPVKPNDQVIDASVLGQKFQADLCGALADGFDAGADLLDKKGTVIDADNVLKQTFQDKRNTLFLTKVSPVFAAVVPAGAEPKDDATRADFVKLWRSFSKGLKTPKKVW